MEPESVGPGSPADVLGSELALLPSVEDGAPLAVEDAVVAEGAAVVAAAVVRTAECEGLAAAFADVEPVVPAACPVPEESPVGRPGMFPLVDGSETEEPWLELESTSAVAVPTDNAAARVTKTAIRPSRLEFAWRLRLPARGRCGGGAAPRAGASAEARTTGMGPEFDSAARTSAMFNGTVRSSGPSV